MSAFSVPHFPTRARIEFFADLEEFTGVAPGRYDVLNHFQLCVNNDGEKALCQDKQREFAGNPGLR